MPRVGMCEDPKPGRPRRKLVPVFRMDGERIYPDWRVLSIKELLRPDEVADILRISVSKVYYMCCVGDLECVKIGGNVRIKSRSVRRVFNDSDKE